MTHGQDIGIQTLFAYNDPPNEEMVLPEKVWTRKGHMAMFSKSQERGFWVSLGDF